MKFLVRSTVVSLFLCLLTVASVAAQALDCPALFQAARQAAVEHCAGLERNQACLASGTASLETQPGYEDTAFTQPGDIIDAAAIASLSTSSAEDWPLVVMRLQLNQPESAVEHNSVVMLLGDVTLTAEEPPETPPLPADQVREVTPAPLTAISFTSTPGGCAGTLPEGLLIQSPNLMPGQEGYVPTKVQINGWDFALGSTVLIESGADGSTVAEVLEHYLEVGAEDGSTLVLVGENIELPPGTPFVGSEDGSVVVVGSDGVASEPESSIFDFLDELLGTEEVANRQPPPPPASDGGTTIRLPGETRRSTVVADGFWHYGVGLSSTFGDCLMGGFDMTETSSIATLDEFIAYDDNGELLGYVWATMGSPTVLPLEEVYPDVYLAEERNPIGVTMFEVEVITRFALAVTVTQTMDGVQGICYIETPILLQSCLVDALYLSTDGNGLCPANVHEAMGTN